MREVENVGVECSEEGELENGVGGIVREKERGEGEGRWGRGGV